jgi:hypothetical protein
MISCAAANRPSLFPSSSPVPSPSPPCPYLAFQLHISRATREKDTNPELVVGQSEDGVREDAREADDPEDVLSTEPETLVQVLSHGNPLVDGGVMLNVLSR